MSKKVSKKRDRQVEKDAIITEMDLAKKKAFDTAKELHTMYSKNVEVLLQLEAANASGEDMLRSCLPISDEIETKSKELRSLKKKCEQLEKKRKKILE